MTSQRLNAKAASEYAGLAVPTLAKMRCCGGGPEFLKLGRRVVYEREAIDGWLAARRVQSTSDSERLPRRLTDTLASTLTGGR
jgi:hypothetical protein